jgi:hypothetical protein
MQREVLRAEKPFSRKNLGDASASPVCYFPILLLVLLFLLCLFLGCHGSILPSIFHGLLCNGAQLQLIECIESIKSDVKKKMMLSRACDPYTKVTRDRLSRNFCERERLRRSFPVFSSSRSSSRILAFRLSLDQKSAMAGSTNAHSRFANSDVYSGRRIYN